MEDPARMPIEKPAFGMFVGSVIVPDGMDDLRGWHLGLDGIEKADELLMAVALHVLPGHGAVEDVVGRKQRRGAVPL